MHPRDQLTVFSKTTELRKIAAPQNGPVRSLAVWPAGLHGCRPPMSVALQLARVDVQRQAQYEPQWSIAWTPRMTNIRTGPETLLPLRTRRKFPFAPNTNPEWQRPPPPPGLKKAAPSKAAIAGASELTDQSSDLLREADELEKASTRVPPLRVQLGNVILSNEERDPNFVKKILKDWDTRGKGEFLRGEFRMNLRSLGLNVRACTCLCGLDSPISCV